MSDGRRNETSKSKSSMGYSNLFLWNINELCMRFFYTLSDVKTSVSETPRLGNTTK